MFLAGESHGRRSLAGHGPQGRRELDTTKVTKHAQPKRRIAGSYGSSVFSCLRHFHFVVFHSGCTNLQSHQKYMRVPVSLHLSHLLFLVFLIIPILIGVSYFVLICISLIISDIECL